MRVRREGIKKGEKKLICFLSDSFDRKLCKTLFGENMIYTYREGENRKKNGLSRIKKKSPGDIIVDVMVLKSLRPLTTC